MNGSLPKKALAGDASPVFVARVLHETRGLVTRIVICVTTAPGPFFTVAYSNRRVTKTRSIDINEIAHLTLYIGVATTRRLARHGSSRRRGKRTRVRIITWRTK